MILKTFSKKQKIKLEQDLEKILVQIEVLKKDDPFADPDHATDNAAVDTDVREQVGHETIEAQIKDLARRVREINLALTKISKNVYGKCERCSKPIAVARLNLIPEARYCITCERKLRV